MIYQLGNIRLQFNTIVLLALLWGLSCSKEKMPAFDSENQVSQIIQQWNSLYLDLDRFTSNYRPPNAARNFAYISLIAYETALPALENNISMAPILTGLDLSHIKVPHNYCLFVALNTSYAYSFRYFFKSAPAEQIEKINQLENLLNDANKKYVTPAECDSSNFFAKEISSTIIKWSSTDRVGDAAIFEIFDSCYIIPEKPGNWSSPKLHPSLPLLPHWGKVRPFIVDHSAIPINIPMEYSVNKSSKMYKEALEIYSISQPLSEENKWISEFWSDDHHGLTYTPSTRWVSVANQVINLNKPSIDKRLETYLKIGMAMCDGGIIAWKEKYTYMRERPQDYINRVINPTWVSFHDSPPFPSFPSGHSVFGSAAAEVLSQLYGYQFAMTDFSHINRREFKGNPRSFGSFYEMAKENAFSRISMGVHYRNDCEEGLRIGFMVGKAVGKINLKVSSEASLYHVK